MTKAIQTRKQTNININNRSKAIKKQSKEVKWDRSKLAVGDFFSCHQYMRVTNVKRNVVTLVNERGESLCIAKDVLVSDSYSANHFETSVSCNMTELSDILKSAKDTIFTVRFLKSVDLNTIEQRMKGLSLEDFKGDKKMAGELLKGEECILIGHLVECDQVMGRSLVTDL